MTTWLAWVLTVVLLVSVWSTTVGFVGDSAHRIGQGAHLLMGLAMIAMAWGWDSQWPLEVLAGVFLVAAVWYLVVAFGGHRGGRGVAHRPWTDVSHAIMMASMAWMYLAMTQMTGHDSAMSGHSGAMLGDALSLAGVVVLAAMLVAALALAWEVLDPPSVISTQVRGYRINAAGASLMALSMAVMTIPMLWA